MGTATFVTDDNGVETQFFLNLPFGETFVEQQLAGTYENPYKFNVKELDSETGLYYYGARYYNPRFSFWYGVDPLAIYNPVMETEFYGEGQHNGGVYFWGNLNPYIYTYQNPIRYVDPNGKQNESWVINWVPNQRGSFGIHRLAKYDRTQRGPNHWNIYAHGIKGGGFQVVHRNGVPSYVTSVRRIIREISDVSPNFKEKLNSGQEITVRFMVCNERVSARDEGLIKTIKEATVLYPNLTAEVSTGLVIVEYDEKSAKFKGVWDRYAIPDSEGRKGSYVTIKNGETINTDSSVGLKPSTPEERKQNADSKEEEYDNPNDDYNDVHKEWKTKPR